MAISKSNIKRRTRRKVHRSGSSTQLIGAQAEPNTLKMRLQSGETELQRRAEFMVEGMAMNSLVGLAFSTKLGSLDLSECFAQMLERARAVVDRRTQSQELILAGQIMSLNAIYTDLALIARANMSNAVIFERLMRLALKAQSNCRATAEALAAVQNPPTVFARQANITSGPQQINNAASAARAGESAFMPNELLEAHGERLDVGTASATINRDQAMETVGKIHRPKNDGR